MPSTQFCNASVLALAAGFLQLAQTDAAVQYSWPRHGGPEHCRTFGKELKIKNTDVQNVTYYSNAQTVQLPGADACSQSTDVSVPLCRLSLLVHTSSSSQVKMEIWLPDDWSGRVAAVGNGGLNGCRFS
jgi:feruloyl esterase